MEFHLDYIKNTFSFRKNICIPMRFYQQSFKIITELKFSEIQKKITSEQN